MNALLLVLMGFVASLNIACAIDSLVNRDGVGIFLCNALPALLLLIELAAILS